MDQFALTVRYTSGTKEFDGLDHYYGTQSLFGLSQVLLISINALANREIITQAPAAKGFRIILGTSKRGSWEQLLQVVVTDPQVQEVLADLGKNALYDLLKWALMGGLGVPVVLQYRKARKRARELERQNDDLQEKLDDALRRAHAPVKHQGLTVHVMTGRKVLATFDDMSLQFLETEIVNDETEIIERAISRFNARTGTGRSIQTLDSTSIPFFPLDKLPKAHSTALADSLAQVTREVFDPVRLLVSEVTDGSGRVKRYRLHRVMP